MHMLRSDADFFTDFGEIYFSFINPGVVKGWKKHLKKTQHFAVPVGNIKLVIYDDREDSKTNNKIQEICIGKDEYKLVRIPSRVWYSFKAVGNEKAMIANCTDIPHDPDEAVTLDYLDKSIPYDWSQDE